MAPPTRPTAATLAALGAVVVGAPALGVLAAAPADAAVEPAVYTVHAGQTLSHVALATGASVDALARANGISDTDLVLEGARLTVPSGPAAAVTHVVAAGESLSGIALSTGSSVAALAAANGIAAPYRIIEGQRLIVVAADAAAAAATVEAATTTAAPPRATGPVEVTVAPGDTLSGIAATAGVPLRSLLASSGLGPGALLQPGQVLTLPAAAAAATKPVASTFAGRSYPPAVTASATANRDALAARSVPSREEVRAIVGSTARQMGVDPALAQAVAHQESGFNARAVSPADAVGAMQVIPSSGRWASDIVGRDLDLLDPEDNAVAGVAILRALTRSTDDRDEVIGGYYQGLRSVQQNGFYPDTVRYVANVTALAARYR